ncbi:hypothetical protein [Desulfoluna sp.]|uniref:hypothetical protein n=1 Tax=Desulfoluna sp. TaxID=2045199 RepID=UPI00263450B2|nr:hypothetical protein [Desulfoluna sp.]
MNNFKPILVFSGALNFLFAIFQVVISFSPSLSLYFGAPEALVVNSCLLIFVSFIIAGIVAIFGLYAISGAGYFRPLPWLKPMLVVICCVYLLRGLMLIPECLVVAGVMQASIPIAPRFVVFSAGSLLFGLLFVMGTVGGWKTFPSRG